MKSLLFSIIALLFIGCSSNKTYPYEEWASLKTPEIFSTNALWSFVILGKDGDIRQRFSLKFADSSAETCSSGEWKRIDIVSEFPVRHGSFEGKPAYYLNGAALIIDLSANLCDAGYELKGQIKESGVSGEHYPVSMFGGEVQGKFYGVPVEGT